MPTRYFNLPEIDPAAPFDGANDINALAHAVDSALETVEVLGRDATFKLEPATRTKLGGVIVGNGVEVGQDGTISVNVDPYELPPATHSSLGGVIVGNGINVAPDGVISIDDAAITLPPNSVGTEQLVDGAVTSPKIGNKTVTFEKLSPALQDNINDGIAYAEGNAERVAVTLKIGDGNTVKVFNWGPVYTVVIDNAVFSANNNSSFDVLSFNKGLGSAHFTSPQIPCEVFKGEAHQTFGTLVISGTKIELRTNDALAAGDYKLVANGSFYWLS